MPYCLSCGSKTDFETADCHDCGQAITRRIEPPGGAVVDDSEPIEDGQSDATDTDAERDTDSETVDTAEPPTTDTSGPSPFADRWAIPFAATYPVRGDYRPLVVGAAVALLGLALPFLLLVLVGYGFRLLRATARGQAQRPAFEAYDELFVDGLKWAFVPAIYGFVVFLGAIAAIVAGAVDEPIGQALWVAVGFVGVYPLPASLTVYGATDDLRAAFARGHAGRFATSWLYLKAWLGWLVVVALSAILATVSALTLVGPLVVQPWSIYAQATVWGHSYRAAVAREIVPPAPDEPVA